MLYAAIAVAAVLFVVGGYLLVSALRKSKVVEDAGEAVEEEPVAKKPYVPKANKPEPEAKPAPAPRAKPPAPKSPLKADDNPFANFG